MKIELRVEGCLVRGGKLLLVNHVRERESYWVLPGGHVEPLEMLQETLGRELLEELGLEVNVGPLVLVHQTLLEERHTVNFTFVVSGFDVKQLKLVPGKRLRDCRWVSAEEIPALDVRPPLGEVLQGFARGEFPGKIEVHTFGRGE